MTNHSQNKTSETTHVLPMRSRRSRAVSLPLSAAGACLPSVELCVGGGGASLGARLAAAESEAAEDRADGAGPALPSASAAAAAAEGGEGSLFASSLRAAAALFLVLLLFGCFFAFTRCGLALGAGAGADADADADAEAGLLFWELLFPAEVAAVEEGSEVAGAERSRADSTRRRMRIEIITVTQPIG